MTETFLLFFQYHAGPWGGCSALCGSGGVRKREVTCFKKDNGTVVALEESEYVDSEGMVHGGVLESGLYL